MNLCGARVAGSMPLPSANQAKKSTDPAADQFPAGLRVLVVDDDPTCLKILERMLRTCLYEVTKCDRAEYALNELRRNKNGFDIVISDVHMPDMDGFKLLEHVGLEMDLPVIMMSADDSKSVVMKGVTHGACDYLIKPVRIEALKNIWQHVVRKKKNEWKDIEQSGSVDEGDTAQKQEDAEYSSAANEGSWKSSKRRGDDEEGDDKDDTSALKKPRVVWSVELHQQFVAAVNQLGIDKAVPKKILELMNVPGLTRENVASHLQKYRLYLRRLSGVSQHQGGLNNPFMNPQDPSFGAMSSLSGIDLQTLAAAGQIPSQALAGYQPGVGRSAIKPGMSMPFIDQRNLFSFETPKLRFADGQHLQQLNNNSKQMNLLHGIPTTMELKQIAGFHQSAQAMGGLNMQTNVQGSQSNNLLASMVQPQSRSGQSMNDGVSNQISLGQSISPAIPSVGILPRTGIADNTRAMPYCSVSQASSMADFPANHVTDMPCNSFPLGSTPAITTITKGIMQDEVNSNMKRPRGFGPNYDLFNELPQQKRQDWQSSSMGYGISQHTSSVSNNIDVSPSILVNQGFPPSQKTGKNSTAANSTVFSTGMEMLQQQGSSTHRVNNVLMDNVSSRVKTETVQESSSGNNHYSFQYGQDDLMSAFLKQQQEGGVVSVEGEFDFDGYTLDNIPV